MDSIIGLVKFLVGAIVALVALVLILLVVISRMPADNPLRQVLNILVARVGATAAAGVLAIPIEPIPGLDVVYNVSAAALLMYYWYTFFRRIGPSLRQRPSKRPDQNLR